MSKITMDTVVELHNNGEKTFKSEWDSKPVIIKKGKHINIVYGLALHFQEQSADLEIMEPEQEEVEPREPVNPLEQTDRGAAFEELD